VVRVVDLRSPSAAAPPNVEVYASAGAELLRLIGVLIAADAVDFDIGPDRISALRARLPGELLAAADALGTDPEASDHTLAGDDKAFLVLSLLGAVLPAPAGVDELLAYLRADPGIGWRMLLAHHSQGEFEDSAAVLPRLIAGDQAAIDDVREHVGRSDELREARSLLRLDPEAYDAQLIEVIDGVAQHLWNAVATEAMGPIARDVAHRRELLEAGTDPSKVVLDATNGYELSDNPSVDRVVLLPSYFFRPWLVVGFIDGMAVEVISTVVADEFLALPSEAPPPALLKLFKALSDEGRLKLLRRMTAGPISLTDATAELGVTKATSHHHLSILRQAGLVSMRGEGRSTRYALRDDPPSIARDALAAYIPSRR
jgi:DNA-binding transcriptional ArsR family regulator